MNVLITTGIYPPSIGGPATYAKLLFDELPKKGINIEITSFDSVRHLPRFVRHAVFFFKVIHKGRRADLIFALDPVSVGYPTMRACRFLKKPYILKIVGDYAWEQGTQRYGVTDLLDDFVKKSDNAFNSSVQRLRNIQKEVAQSAKQIIVPSEYLKKIITQWGIDPQHIRVIYNAFDGIDESQIVTDKKKLRTELAIASPTIVSVGRLVPWKGFKELISIIPALLPKFPYLELLIIGDGPDKSLLQAHAHNLGLGHAVHFLGSRSKEELYRYMQASDLFVLNTGYEGLSHVLLEAQALKVPIITTDVGGNAEVIKNGENGVLVEYGDTESLQKQIEDLLLTPKKAQALARDTIQDIRFSKETMLNDITDTIKQNA